VIFTPSSAFNFSMAALVTALSASSVPQIRQTRSGSQYMEAYRKGGKIEFLAKPSCRFPPRLFWKTRTSKLQTRCNAEPNLTTITSAASPCCKLLVLHLNLDTLQRLQFLNPCLGHGAALSQSCKLVRDRQAVSHSRREAKRRQTFRLRPRVLLGILLDDPR
jgi:hypothetical protein